MLKEGSEETKSVSINTLMEGIKKIAKVFPVVLCDRTRGCGHKQTCWRFPLNIRKHSFFIVRMNNWNVPWFFFLGYVQKLAGCGSGQPALGWCYLSWRIESGDLPSKPSHAAILEFCDTQGTVLRHNCDTLNLIQLFNRTTPIIVLIVPYRVKVYMNLGSEDFGSLYWLQ